MCFLKVNTETFEGVLKVHLRYQQLQYTKVLEKSRFRESRLTRSSYRYPHIAFTRWVEFRPEIRSTERKRKCYVQVGDFWTLIKSSVQEIQLDSVKKPQALVIQVRQTTVEQFEQSNWRGSIWAFAVAWDLEVFEIETLESSLTFQAALKGENALLWYIESIIQVKFCSSLFFVGKWSTTHKST